MQCFLILAETLSQCAKHGSDAWRFGVRDAQKTTETPLLRQQGQHSLDRLFVGQLAELGSMSQKIEQRSVSFREISPRFWPSRMNQGLVSNKFPAQA